MVINYVIYSNGSYKAFIKCTGENIPVIGNIICVYGKFPFNANVSSTRSCKYILIVYKTNNYSVLHIAKQVTSDQEESTSLNIVLISIATSSTFTIVNPQHACARWLL